MQIKHGKIQHYRHRVHNRLLRLRLRRNTDGSLHIMHADDLYVQLCAYMCFSVSEASASMIDLL